MDGEEHHHPDLGADPVQVVHQAVVLRVPVFRFRGHGGRQAEAFLGQSVADVAEAGEAVHAVGVDHGHVGPTELVQDVHDDEGLLAVRRHNAGEETVLVLVAEERAGGGIAELRDPEGRQQGGHLHGALA